MPCKAYNTDISPELYLREALKQLLATSRCNDIQDKMRQNVRLISVLEVPVCYAINSNPLLQEYGIVVKKKQQKNPQHIMCFVRKFGKQSADEESHENRGGEI